MSRRLTFALRINLSRTSTVHFKFISGSGNSSQDNLIYPCGSGFNFGLIPESFGGVGDHRGPAKRMNLCTAAGVPSFKSDIGTMRDLLSAVGCSSFP
jgi:hypothetical protein